MFEYIKMKIKFYKDKKAMEKERLNKILEKYIGFKCYSCKFFYSDRFGGKCAIRDRTIYTNEAEEYDCCPYYSKGRVV